MFLSHPPRLTALIAGALFSSPSDLESFKFLETFFRPHNLCNQLYDLLNGHQCLSAAFIAFSDHRLVEHPI